MAVRLPDDLVRALEIEEGDELEIEADSTGWRILRGARQRAALQTLEALAVAAPPGFRFSRADAYERGGE